MYLPRRRSYRVVLRLGVALLVMAGCGVRSQVSVFHKLPAHGAAKTFVIYPTERQRGDLEFETYAALVSERLTQHGYRAAAPGAVPDLGVMLVYVMDEGRTISGEIPVMGQTGDGTTYHQGTAYGSRGNYATYSGTSYTPPTYGTVGTIPYSRTEYARALILEIHTLAAGTAEKVYEAKVVSRGRSPHLSDSIPAMIEAIFTEFPGRSGRTRSITVSPP